MLREMRVARRLWPDLSPSQILDMATVQGGRATARPALGRLRAGGRADMFAVPAEGKEPGQVLDRLTRGQLPVLATWLAGRNHRQRGSVH